MSADFLRRLVKVFIYLSAFAVWVVMPSTFFPYIGGKYYFFRFTVELAAICLLTYWAFEPAAAEYLRERFRWLKRQPLFWAVSAFAAAFVLAAIFAYNPGAAFWSNYERGEGGFQMIHYYVFFVLLLVLLDSASDWRVFFALLVVAGLGMVGYGLLANVFTGDATSGFRNPFDFVGPYMNTNTGVPAPPGFWERIFAHRFQGSLGNPAYVAPYLLFSIFYAVWLWLTARKDWLKHILFGAATALFLFFFIMSQTRGAFLGLIAATFIFFLGLLISASVKARKVGAIGLMAILIAGGATFYFRDAQLVKNIPGSRVLNLDFGESTAQTRFWTWGSAWQGFKERPVFGWGPENFSPVFDKYFDTRHFVPGTPTETWFDRAHSIIFDYLVETGLVGFLSYVSIFVLVGWAVFKNAIDRRRPGPIPFKTAVLVFLFAAVLVGYLVQGLILFDVLPIYINLFALVAFGAFLFGSSEGHNELGIHHEP